MGHFLIVKRRIYMRSLFPEPLSRALSVCPQAHWWAVLLMGIALIMLMAGFIKVCSVHTPSSNPKLPPPKPLPGKEARHSVCSPALAAGIFRGCYGTWSYVPGLPAPGMWLRFSAFCQSAPANDTGLVLVLSVQKDLELDALVSAWFFCFCFIISPSLFLFW